MEFLPDIFYRTVNLTKKQIRELFIEAKELSYHWHINDQPGWTRRRIDMSFEDILRVFDKTLRKNLHIVFIQRRGYENHDHYLEIGFCTLSRKKEPGDVTEGDLFLWINVDLKHKPHLIKKYFNDIEDIL